MKNLELLVPNAVLRYTLILACLACPWFAGSLVGRALGKAFYYLTH